MLTLASRDFAFSYSQIVHFQNNVYSMSVWKDQGRWSKACELTVASAVSTYTDSGKAITASRFVVLHKIVSLFDTYHFIFTSLVKIKTSVASMLE